MTDLEEELVAELLRTVEVPLPPPVEEFAAGLLLTVAEPLRLVEEPAPALLLTTVVPLFPAADDERLETRVTAPVPDVLPEAAGEVLLTDVRDDTAAAPLPVDGRELPTEVLELPAIPPPVPLDPMFMCPRDGPSKNGS